MMHYNRKILYTIFIISMDRQLNLEYFSNIIYVLLFAKLKKNSLLIYILKSMHTHYYYFIK